MPRIILLILVLSGLSGAARSESLSTSGDNLAKDFKDPLKVKGQTRALNMALILKGREDKIRFMKVRKDFRSEILSTKY